MQAMGISGTQACPVDLDSPPSSPQRRTKPTKSKSSKRKFYGVQVGRVPGVYTDWPTTQQQVNGWTGAKHKSFTSEEEAWAFVKAIKEATHQPPHYSKQHTDISMGPRGPSSYNAESELPREIIAATLSNSHVPVVPTATVVPISEPPLCKEQADLVDLILSGRNVFYTGERIPL